MKNIGKLALLGAVLAAASSYALADTVNLASYGAAGLSSYQPTVTGVANTAMEFVAAETYTTVAGIPATVPSPFTNTGNGGATSYTAGVEATDLNPAGTWNPAIANSSWVGAYANAGPQSTSNPEYGYYEYTTEFTVSGGLYSGSIDVQADDTTEVLLDGTVIVPFGSLGSDLHCANGLPTCTATDVVSITNVALASGTDANTLEFIVEQAGTGPVGGTTDPSGVDFTATLAATPEPSSLMLLGTGLLGAAGMLFRRRVSA